MENGRKRPTEEWRQFSQSGFGQLRISVFRISMRFFAVVPIINIIEGAIEFPATKTRTFQGVLLISRAYEMHGKGKSWHIQTQPIWTDIDITQQDFRFMQAHRRQDDLPGKSDEIRSDGYFCANVTLQSAGDALRVVHAGRSTLPKGSIGVCPR